MKKIALFFAWLPSMLFAQLNFNNLNLFSSAGQKFVEQAVTDGILLLRQDYYLLDSTTNIKYGWNNQEMFSSVYSTAIHVGNRYFVSDYFVHPWQADSRYLQFQDTVLIPTISQTHQRKLTDTIWTKQSYDISSLTAIKDSCLYMLDSLQLPAPGFNLDTTSGNKEGWLVWVVTPDTLMNDKSPIEIITYKHSLTIEPQTYLYEIPKPTFTKQIIGAFYVIPHVPQVGLLEFQMGGILFVQNNQWFVHKIKLAEQKVEEPQKPTLTPIQEPTLDTKDKKKTRKTK